MRFLIIFLYLLVPFQVLSKDIVDLSIELEKILRTKHGLGKYKYFVVNEDLKEKENIRKLLTKLIDKYQKMDNSNSFSGVDSISIGMSNEIRADVFERQAGVSLYLPDTISLEKFNDEINKLSGLDIKSLKNKYKKEDSLRRRLENILKKKGSSPDIVYRSSEISHEEYVNAIENLINTLSKTEYDSLSSNIKYLHFIKDSRTSLRESYKTGKFFISINVNDQDAPKKLSEEMKEFLLQKEIESILKDKFNYSGTGIDRGLFFKSDHHQVMSSLKKFKELISSAKFPRDFSKINGIYLDDENRTTIRNNGKIDLRINTEEPSPSYLKVISSKAKKEPEYIAFEKSQAIKLAKNLKVQFGKWHPYYNKAKSLLCSMQSLGLDNTVEKNVATKHLGAELLDVKHEEYTDDEGQTHRYVEIYYKNRPPSMIRLGSFVKNNKTEYSYIRINDGNKAGDSSYPLIRTILDDDCKHLKSEVSEYNDLILQKRHRLNSAGKVAETYFVNREVIPLETVYSNCPKSKPFPIIQEIVNRTDRVLVTIFDTGVDYNHPKLAYKVPRTNGKVIGWDFEDDDNSPYDYEGNKYKISSICNHGTHVAGIASKGTDDIAILPIRYPDSFKNRSRHYDAIKLAHNQGSRIVNISLRSSNKEYWKSLKEAIEDYPDMLFIAAAGNERDNGKGNLDEFPTFPATFKHDNLLVVTSVNSNNELSKFSNFSKIHVDLAAPGEGIVAPTPENTTSCYSGTSMATPFVTNIAAKIKFINPKLSPRQIIGILRDSVTPVDNLKFKVKYGGVANEKKALELAKKTLNQ